MGSSSVILARGAARRDQLEEFVRRGKVGADASVEPRPVMMDTEEPAICAGPAMGVGSIMLIASRRGGTAED